jgi:hypothetical protein
MPTTLERPQTPAEARPPAQRAPAPPAKRFGPLVLLAIIVAAAVVAGIVTVVLTGREEAPPQPQPAAQEPLDAEAYWTQWAQVRGFVPTYAVPPSLYTREERLMLRLADQGLIPKESLDQELLLTKRLVNEGLIPVEAVR